MAVDIVIPAKIFVIVGKWILHIVLKITTMMIDAIYKVLPPLYRGIGW
ncbi:MAG: hypothetical protein WC455_13745 [Dehalococcoidia bacterium]|jgi:hypothetical protein